MIVAVSIVDAGNAPEPVDHVTVPVYSVVPDTALTGVAPVTGTVTPEITGFEITTSLTWTTNVARVGEPIVAVYVPALAPVFKLRVKLPEEFVSVTLCGEPLVTGELEIVVLEPEVSVHVPPETVTGVLGLPPEFPDRVSEIVDVGAET